MEIEAKFAVSDATTFERLLALEGLGEYALVPGGERWITDRYMDTPELDLLRGGHACRLRRDEAGGPEMVAIKGVGGARGAVHRRAEHEMEAPPGMKPAQWPASAVREIVLRLAGDRPLVEVLTLRQHRTTRDVVREGQRVAVLSLDRVELGPGATSSDLEIELTPGGREADLADLQKLLRPYGLRPQSQSKFERALALLGEGRGRRGGNRGRRARAEGPS